MRYLFFWMCFIAFPFFGTLDLYLTDSLLPHWLTGCLLFFVGVLAGIRIGNDSAVVYVGWLFRMNKFLAEQNRELSELNYEHLNSTVRHLRRETSSHETPSDL